MKFQHRFRVRASLAAVAEFHSQTASLAVLTPPPVIVRIQRAPAIQHAGDEVDFTMWFGPLPIRWLAQIDQVSDTGFVDRQVRGAFQACSTSRGEQSRQASARSSLRCSISW